jgi:hypothetical protein
MTLLHKIPYVIAQRILFFFIGATVVFHILVLTGIIPFTIVWGGRLQDHQQMVTFELISLSNLLFLFFIIQLKSKTRRKGLQKVATFILWFFAFMFVLNTVGNLLAKATLETLLFTPLTFISAILCARLAIEK